MVAGAASVKPGWSPKHKEQCELKETSPKQISQKFDKIQFSAYPAKSEEIDLQDKEKKFVSVSHWDVFTFKYETFLAKKGI